MSLELSSKLTRAGVKTGWNLFIKWLRVPVPGVYTSPVIFIMSTRYHFFEYVQSLELDFGL